MERGTGVFLDPESNDDFNFGTLFKADAFSWEAYNIKICGI